MLKTTNVFLKPFKVFSVFLNTLNSFIIVICIEEQEVFVEI